MLVELKLRNWATLNSTLCLEYGGSPRHLQRIEVAAVNIQLTFTALFHRVDLLFFRISFIFSSQYWHRPTQTRTHRPAVHFNSVSAQIYGSLFKSYVYFCSKFVLLHSLRWADGVYRGANARRSSHVHDSRSCSNEVHKYIFWQWTMRTYRTLLNLLPRIMQWTRLDTGQCGQCGVWTVWTTGWMFISSSPFFNLLFAIALPVSHSLVPLSHFRSMHETHLLSI